MTSKDRIAVLDLAREQQNRLGNGENHGGLKFNKLNGSPYGWDVAETMAKHNGTFRFTDPDKFDTIYEELAAETYAAGGSSRDKIDAAIEHATAMKSGVRTLKTWLDEQFGVPMYFLKGSKSGNRVICITIHDEEMAEEGDAPAREKALAAQRSATIGQLIRMRKTIQRVEGETFAQQALRAAVDKAAVATIMQPRRERLEYSDDD